jgi:hypothetical protein
VIAVLLLYVLATLDAALSGYRAAGGRNALIRKRVYQAKAQLRGAIWGQAGIIVIAAFAGLLLATDAEPARLIADLLEGCERTLVIYLPYSLVFVVAFVLRVVPSVDVRSTLNTLIFGPFTFLRPFVGLAGVVWAVICVPRWEVLSVGLFALAVMLGVEWGLNRWYAWKSQTVSAESNR